MTVNSALSVGATFQGPYVLAVNKGGAQGTVQSIPAAIDCGATCSAAIAPGTAVKLTATPAAGNVFIGWKGVCSGPAPCSFTMSTDVTIEADFGTPATWDPNWNAAGITYSNNNLTIASSTVIHKSARATVGRANGRSYWEVKVNTGVAATDNGGLGIVEKAFPPTNTGYIGDGTPSGLSFGYGNNPFYYYTWAGVTVSTTPPPTASYVAAGITYMFALDVDAGKLWCGQNGSWYGGGDPPSGANPTASGLTGTIFPAVTFYDTVDSYTANFGGSFFTYPPPIGFPPGLF